MKRTFTLLLCSIFTLVLHAQAPISFSQNFSQHTSDRAYEVSYDEPAIGEYQISFTINNVDVIDVVKNGTTYSKISFASSTVTEKRGWAELPYVSASIQLPADKNVTTAQIDATDVIEFPVSHPVIPSRGVIYRDQDPEDVPYVIAPESVVNGFYPSLEDSTITMENPFILRDVRGTTLHFFPFHYNPVTNTIRFYRQVTVTLREDASEPINPLVNAATVPCHEAIGMYQSIFINYFGSFRDALVQGEKGDLLVITPSTYENAIEPYIQWKKEMGFSVAKSVVPTGTDVTSLIQEAYNANNNLMYVQLVGDWDDIKSNTIYMQTEGGDVPADPTMGCVAGNDYYPDIAIGRFSCNNADELTIQVNKTIKYEKEPNMDADWRETFIGIGSQSGSSDGDDSEADYVHIQRIFSERLSHFTYTTEKGNYGNSASASNITAHLNAGASTIAYCGHGNANGFGTANYNINHVNNAANGDRLPFIVAAACKNGAFHLSSDCFAEVWLKKQNGGAIVTLMSSINQGWTPPQRGQDYFYDILSGGFDYNLYPNQNGISTTEQRTHWGSIVINAFNLALTESHYATDLETFKTWTTFGDVSLQLRTKQPDVIAIDNSELKEGVPYTATITANGVPVQDALVCLSQDGSYVSGYTDFAGEVSLEHNFQTGDVLLVVTAFNTTTIYDTLFCVMDPSLAASPKIALGSYHCPTFNSTAPAMLSLAMVNNGDAATTDYTSVTISCDDPLITITDGIGNAAPMAALGGVAILDNEFQILVSSTAVAGSVFYINWTATVGDSTWTGTFPLYVSSSSCAAPTGVSAMVSNHDVVLRWDAETTMTDVVMADDVEGHTYGDINSGGPLGWTYIDGDAAYTAILPNAIYTHAGSKMAYIVMDDDRVFGLSVVQAHSGNKYFGAPASLVKTLFRLPQNDDWLISPRLDFDAPITFSFYARSYCSVLSKEKFYAAYSTSGNQSGNFINLTSSAVTTNSSWTKYTYTVPANAKYVAIHCVSSGQYMLCVDDITISSKVSQDETYNVYRNGELIAAGIPGGTFTDMNVGYGNYCYTVTHNCDDGTESLPSDLFCVTVGAEFADGEISADGGAAEQCEDPENLIQIPFANYNGLSWNEVEGALAYRIYRNGTPIANTYSHYYTDVNINPNLSYSYEVESICANSLPGHDIPNKSLVTIENNEQNGILIFPNPAKSVLNIQGEDIKEIRIYSAIGALVQKISPAQQTTQIPVSDFDNGIYFVKVSTASTQYTEKVIIQN